MNSASETVTYGPPRWMMSFADLMSVILTFFVLLFSMSAPPKAKDHAENKPVENKLVGDSPASFSGKTTSVETKIKTAKTDQGLSTNYIADIVKNRIADLPVLSHISLDPQDDKLVISMPASDFNDEYAAGLVQSLRMLNNKIAVYSGNLDQSKAVVEKLQQKGFDKNISYFESHDARSKIDIAIYP